MENFLETVFKAKLEICQGYFRSPVRFAGPSAPLSYQIFGIIIIMQGVYVNLKWKTIFSSFCQNRTSVHMFALFLR